MSLPESAPNNAPAADSQQPSGDNVQLGVFLAIAGYGIFSAQDAIVKWLVEGHTIWQLLFVRSLTVCLAILLFKRGSAVAGVIRSPNKKSLAVRAGLILIAWLCYYTAAKDLTLPDLVTLYYAAPIFIMVMSIFILREQVTWARWLSVIVGFIGVVVAANPGGRPDLWPAFLVLLAAIFWSASAILMRKSMRDDSSLIQMLFSNGLFVIVCGATLPWTWDATDWFSFALMIGLGFSSGTGQFLLFESFRRAPASVVAPAEYTALVWAVILGYIVFQDLPTWSGVIGAVLIVMASGIVLVAERRKKPA